LKIKQKAMQFKLPLFPSDTRLINEHAGIRLADGFVYYLHSGSPIYCHKEEDKNSYRHTLASLAVNNLCTIGEWSSALGIPLSLIVKLTALPFLKNSGTGTALPLLPAVKT
jgi:hypothetical protein